MVTIKNALIYSVAGQMAYEIQYSDGVAVRVVESADRIIRKEYKTDGGWKQSGKPYVVKASRKRQAERMKAEVIAHRLKAEG